MRCLMVAGPLLGGRCLWWVKVLARYLDSRALANETQFRCG